MNSRRRMSNIRQPLPWLRRWSVYRTRSLLRRARQVLGVDLNCSETEAADRGPNVRFGSKADLRRSLGPNPLHPRKRTLAGRHWHVRFVPIAGISLPTRSPRQRGPAASAGRRGRALSPALDLLSARTWFGAPLADRPALRPCR